MIDHPARKKRIFNDQQQQQSLHNDNYHSTKEPIILSARRAYQQREEDPHHLQKQQVLTGSSSQHPKTTQTVRRIFELNVDQHRSRFLTPNQSRNKQENCAKKNFEARRPGGGFSSNGNHLNFQNEGDTQCNYEEEDSFEESILLWHTKQLPTIETAVAFTECLPAFKIIIQYLQFEDLIQLKHVCKIYNSPQFQAHIKKRVVICVKQGLTPQQQYLFYNNHINFSAIQRKYELQYYNHTLNPSGYDSQILQDIHRTYPDKKEFLDGKQLEKLKKVLRAISHSVKEVGYVQGLNQVVGQLLHRQQFKENEVYWISIYLLKKMKLKDILKDGFPRLRILTFQLEIFMQNYLPDLLLFLNHNQISVSYFCTKWFITLFSYDIDNFTLMKLWNLFFLKGWKVLIKVALGLLKLFEKDIYAEPAETLSSFIINFATSNYGNSMITNNLIDTAQGLKVTNRLLHNLENIYELHTQSQLRLTGLTILLFPNHLLKGALDWKILPQAPHFEGQNSTLELLNKHSTVIDYFNELNQIQFSKSHKNPMDSRISQTNTKHSEGRQLSQRSLSHTHSQSQQPQLFMKKINSESYQKEESISRDTIGRQSLQSLNSGRRKRATTTYQEKKGFLQNLSNKIISIFKSEDEETISDNTINSYYSNQGRQNELEVRISKNQEDSKQYPQKREIQPIHILYQNPMVTQNSLQQLSFPPQNSLKYYDQVLGDMQEIRDTLETTSHYLEDSQSIKQKSPFSKDTSITSVQHQSSKQNLYPFQRDNDQRASSTIRHNQASKHLQDHISFGFQQRQSLGKIPQKHQQNLEDEDVSDERSVENASSTDIGEFDASPSIKPVLNSTKKFSVMKKESVDEMQARKRGKENYQSVSSVNSQYQTTPFRISSQGFIPHFEMNLSRK